MIGAPGGNADEQRVRELFERALEAGATDDEDARWDRVSDLQRTGGEPALHEAVRLCASDDPERRVLAVDVLGQLCGPTAGDDVVGRVRVPVGRGLPGLVPRGPDNRDATHEAAVRALVALASREHHPDVLHSIGIALGHRQDPRAIGPLRRWRTHADADVRYAVVFGLLGLADDEAVSTLIEMSSDLDDRVRDWATFGLARQVRTDTPAVREALAARLYDPDHDTRAEAIAGLALRRDDRVVAALLDALASDDWPGADPDMIHTALHAMAHATEDRRLWRHVRSHPGWLARHHR